MRWLGRAVKGLGRGFSSIKSNAGYGFSALKGDPKTVLGGGVLMPTIRSLQAGEHRAGQLGWRNVMKGAGSNLKTWGSVSDLAGQGRLRGVAGASRAGAVAGGMAGLDFLNPWGLGWGD